MPGPLLALLVACSGGPPPATPAPDVDLAPGRGQVVERLLDHAAEAELALSPGNLPAGADQPTTTPLRQGWEAAPWGNGGIWMHPAPQELPPDRYTSAPDGVLLRSGTRALTYDTRISDDANLSQRWMMWDGRVYLASRLDPDRWPEPPALERAAAAAREASWNLALSGQAPIDFAVRSLSLGRVTKPCLYLPAPSRAVLPVDVPADGGTLLLDVGLGAPEGEEATASASLVLRLGEADLGRTTVRAGEAWTPVRVDLAPWAGQRVDLRLESDPDGDPLRDYLCVGAPRLLHAAPPTPDPVRIVVLGIDTLRADHLGAHGYARPTSPHLDALAAQSVVFDRAWAPAPRTRPSFRTSTTGRWPLRALSTPSLGRVLGSAGFATAGIVANVHLAPRLGFADGYDLWSYENGAPADVQVDRAVAWLTTHRDEDAFLFLHLMDPHTFYLPPAPYLDRFVDPADRGDVPDRFNRWMVQNWQDAGELTEAERRFIAGRYDGELAFTDAQVGRLLEALDALPGRTLLLVHTDHGEELWDHGAFEHNHSLYEELTRALLWVRPPGGRPGGLRVAHPASLADIAPTLYEAAGVPAADQPAMDGTSLWPLLDPGEAPRAPALAQALDTRPLHLGYLMFDTERWGVVARGPTGALHKYLLVSATGEQQLYDLEADPGERRNLADEAGFDPAPWAAALGRATGWPVGPGWRLHLERARQAFTLRFEASVEAAGVIDPEAALKRRANLEWGELPATVPGDVATVQLSPDRRELRVTPGPLGSGTLYVFGPAADAAAQATWELDGQPLRPGAGPHPLPDGGRMLVSPGMLILPRETEASALTGHAPDGSATDEQLRALRELGYIGGD